MTPSEIAQWTHSEKHNITTPIDSLDKDRLVRTKRNEKDMRSVNLTLTDRGRKVLTQAVPMARETVNQAMSSTSDAILLEESPRVLRQNAQHGLEHIAKRSRPQPD